MTNIQKKLEAYVFGPIIFAENTRSDVIINISDLSAIEIIKSGQQGLQVALKVRKFSCSICNEDYVVCEHEASTTYEGKQCTPFMSEWEVMYVSLVHKASDVRARITDMLLIQTDKDSKQYVWYGYPIDSANSRLAHIQVAYSHNLINKPSKDHFDKIFHVALNGIATYPPNPEFILKQGYRIDWLQTPESMTEKKESELRTNGNKDARYIRMRIEFDPERYASVIIDNIEYRYDKFDKILIPYKETMDQFMKNSIGAPIYWIRPKIENIVEYINSRIQEIETSFSKDPPYKFVDISEDFLSKLKEQYVNKFVILNIDIKCSTMTSFDLSLQTNALITRIYSREMTRIVANYHGFILKYMGDGILAYFPIPTFWGMDDNALDCAVTMKFMIEKGINKVLQKRNIPRIKFRIGMDSGEAVVTSIGDESSKQHKDLIGSTINLTTKIQSSAEENHILVGDTMLRNLGVHRRKLFQEYVPKGWNYTLPNIQGFYPIYKLVDVETK